ncbi:hypothetical protein JG688_00015940 [Phytophthora aleatoria]|uniref:Uncharacterized protein n=1 Tax=Phytophthora aleatoria TaxID=2496075 RepID=A0A8J5MD47_9STRA|nr:hypothetical protein JG688_00015940 [Phytophthora aleatoria]
MCRPMTQTGVAGAAICRTFSRWCVVTRSGSSMRRSLPVRLARHPSSTGHGKAIALAVSPFQAGISA